MGWGDDIMVTGQARVMQQHDPRRVRVLYEKQWWFPAAYQNNPRLAVPAEYGDFQILRPREYGLRPYCSAKNAQQWTWRRYTPPVGELYFSATERQFGERWADRVLLEPHIKHGASPNKQWGWVHWNKLAWLLARRGIPTAQMGPSGTAQLEGVEFITTPSMRLAAAVLSNAAGAVLPEGGLHHTAAVFGIPAVVIYGGFISPEVTGYAGQVSLFTASHEYPLGCGWRKPCTHCAEAMAGIKPEKVAEELERILEPVSA